jgi:hypothetical protein
MADRMVFFKLMLLSGAANALDGIDGTDRGDGEPLQDLDLAFTVDTSILYVHQLDADSAAAESSPDVVKPDTNAGDKRWILLAKVEDISAYVAKAAYNAYTILYADSDDTPLPLTVGASTIVGRKSTGGIVALTKAEVLAIINVADGANAYTHPNHSGDVTSAADGAQTIAAKAVHVSMLADGTDGELITWGTDGVATVVAAGADGYKLTSHGAGAVPTWESPGAGGLTDIVDDTTPQLGGDLDLNTKAISVAPAPAADTFEGFSIVLEAHEDMVIGSLCYIDASGEAALTDADAAATMPGCVLATAVVDQSADPTGVFLLPGGVIHLHTLAPAWTIGGLVYAGSGAGPHTPGALNQTPPAGDSDVVQIVGVALAADILLFIPSLVTVEAHA